ncbi:MAG: hypothetical protein H7Z39_19715 [Burkholderiaceae bacterium]|nr:hypothetical protein [Burkholderiaceae bacterium]
MNTRAKKTDSAIPAVKAEPLTQPRKGAKQPKLVRDHCEMLDTEYAALAEIKKACREAGIEVKKNDLLRVALAQVGDMDAPGLKQALDALPPLKGGRPGKDK